MPIYIVKVKRTALRSPLAPDGTTVKLKDFVDIKENALLMASFGSWFVIVIRQGDQVEMIECDGITQNANGTADLSIATNGRYLNATTPFAGSSTGLNFQTGEVIVSNDPKTISQFANKNNTESISGLWTFASATRPKQSTDTDSTANEEYITKGELIRTALGSISLSSLISAATSGETVAESDFLYKNDADGEWYKSLADDSSKCENVALSVSLGAGTDGNQIAGGVLKRGPVSSITGLTDGAKYYLTDAGGIDTSPGTIEVVIGYGLPNGTLYFDPHYDTKLTKDQQDAFEGTRGTPDTNNKLVTDEDTESDGVGPSQLIQDASQSVGQSDATTKAVKVAQSVVVEKQAMKGVKLDKQADTGVFTGDVVVTLEADDGSGDPDGMALATETISNATWSGISVGEFEVTFDSEATGLVVGDTYHIVVSPTTNDDANCINLGTNSAGGYASGSVKDWNTTDGWDDIATIDLYFEIVYTMAGRVVRAKSDGKIHEDFQQFTDTNATALQNGSETSLHVHSPKDWTGGYARFLFDEDIGYDVITNGAGASTTSAALSFAMTNGGAAGGTYQFIQLPATASASGEFDWDNDYVFRANLRLGQAVTQVAFWGMGTDGNPVVTDTDVTRKAGFLVSDDKLYAVVADGATQNKTEITGIDFTTYHDYRMEFTGGGSVLFYIDNVLKATLSANVPTGATDFNPMTIGISGISIQNYLYFLTGVEVWTRA